jgi:acetolactate synthase-1/2/3 large subunit
MFRKLLPRQRRCYSQTPFLNPTRQQRQSLDDASFIGLTGGQIFHEMMLRHNVKVVFGYPGIRN